jgi:hypothetical protein
MISGSSQHHPNSPSLHQQLHHHHLAQQQQVSNRAQDEQQQKLMTAIEILKREKQQLQEQLERRTFAAQAELIENLSNVKADLSSRLFQKTLELDEVQETKRALEAQVTALKQVDAAQQLREHEATIRQLNTVIAELRRHEGKSKAPFVEDELEMPSIEKMVSEIQNAPLETPIRPPVTPQAKTSAHHHHHSPSSSTHGHSTGSLILSPTQSKSKVAPSIPTSPSHHHLSTKTPNNTNSVATTTTATIASHTHTNANSTSESAKEGTSGHRDGTPTVTSTAQAQV